MIQEIFTYLNNNFLIVNGVIIAIMAGSLIYLLNKKKYNSAVGIGIAIAALVSINLLKTWH